MLASSSDDADSSPRITVKVRIPDLKIMVCVSMVKMCRLPRISINCAPPGGRAVGRASAQDFIVRVWKW